MELLFGFDKTELPLLWHKVGIILFSDRVLCLIPSIIAAEQVHNVAQLPGSNEFMHNICLEPQLIKKKKDNMVSNCVLNVPVAPFPSVKLFCSFP